MPVLKGSYSNKCSEGLGFSHFCVQSPCNPLFVDYTYIFYLIDKWDLPSVQCKMSLRGSKSMRQVGGLSLTVIDFYVSGLTPRLNSTETSLQLSESITLFELSHFS
jgi:hypothetical protein